MKTLLLIPFLFVCSLVIGQSSKIIGTPYKLTKFEVAQNDFQDTRDWYDAKKACASLGSGWRLPTKDELYTMYLWKDDIGGFSDFFYWSSTEANSNNAWLRYFQHDGAFNDNKANTLCYVRAVRSL